MTAQPATRRSPTRLALLAAILITLAGCGGATAPAPPASQGASPAARGAAFFQGAGGCSGCHTINGQGGLIGPDLKSIATVAANNTVGLSTEEYLREELLEPTKRVTEGYRADLMPHNYSEIFTPDQIEDLIAYMLTLQ